MSYGNRLRTGNRLCLGKSLAAECLDYKAAVIDQFAAPSSIGKAFLLQRAKIENPSRCNSSHAEKIGEPFTILIFWQSLKTVLETCPLVNVYRLSYPTINIPTKN